MEPRTSPPRKHHHPQAIREDDGLQVRPDDGLPEAYLQGDPADARATPTGRPESSPSTLAPNHGPSPAAGATTPPGQKREAAAAAVAAEGGGGDGGTGGRFIPPVSPSSAAATAGRGGTLASNRRTKKNRWLIILAAGLAISLIANVITGAVLGTKLSYCRPGRRRQNSPGSSPININNYIPPDPTGINQLALDCPGMGGTTVTAPVRGARFRASCGADWAAGCESAEGGGPIHDMATLVTYSLGECLDACAAMGGAGAGGGPPSGWRCLGVTFSARLRESLQTGGTGNCWLKNATLAAGTTCKRRAGAVSAGVVPG